MLRTLRLTKTLAILTRQPKVWEWDSITVQRQLPRWLELLAFAIGLPIVLICVYFIVSTAFDGINIGVFLGVIVLLSIAMARWAHESDLDRPRRLVIRVEKENVSCTFLGKSNVFYLKNLDWSRVEMTSGIKGVLALANKGDDEVKRYPILGMSKLCRRELWRELTRYKVCTES